MTAISYNLITKDSVTATIDCLRNLYGKLFEDGDETILVDTGSTPENYALLEEAVKDFAGLRLLQFTEATYDFLPFIKKWAPEYVEDFEAHYKENTHLLGDFSAARNAALEVSTSPIIFWIDTDDIIEEEIPGSLRAVVKDILITHDKDALFMDYKYAFDEADGSCITTLRRERFFFRERYYWKGRCHETAIPRPGKELREVGYCETLRAAISHTDHRKRSIYSDLRNYVILRRQYEEEKNAQDPRTIFYLGNACRGLRKLQEAIEYYREFDRVSGSPDDRFAAHYYIAGIYMDPTYKRPYEALDEYKRCLDILPQDPRSYYGISRCYAAVCKWEECLHWYRLGSQHRMPSAQVFSYDPSHIEYHPHVVAAHAARELRNYPLSFECAQRAVRARPTLGDARGLYGNIKIAAEGGDLARSVMNTLRYVSGGGPIARLRVGRQICNELLGVPPDLESAGLSSVEPPDPRPRRPEFVIYCGETGEEWGPFSRKAGIGGSEKMVLMLAELIQRAGIWNVTVYCKIPGARRGIDPETGVLWRHWAEIDYDRPRDVLVAWRNPSACLLPLPARVRVVWLHDVANPGAYTPEVLAALDFVQVQSKFHAEPLVEVVGDKLWQARNGIECYLTKSNPDRDSKRVLYFSSPDRGMLTAAKIVAAARKIDPEIHMVAAYGITPWARKAYARSGHLFLPDVGHDISCELYERELNAALDAAKAQNLFRVSFDQMYALLASSGVWLYPTRFWEISCMAAMEAQAFGVLPLCTRSGALKETVLSFADALVAPIADLPSHGDVDQKTIEQIAQELVGACKVAPDDPRRLALAKKAWDSFSVDGLAEEWIEKLKP